MHGWLILFIFAMYFRVQFGWLWKPCTCEPSSFHTANHVAGSSRYLSVAAARADMLDRNGSAGRWNSHSRYINYKILTSLIPFSKKTNKKTNERTV